jgi:NADH-quinone oxidoreductase subunit J
MIETVVFLFFSTLMLLAALTVVLARHPVHAMLALIVTLFNAAGLVLTLRADYLAFMMIVVYGGAVAVLFLFVVMMLGVDRRAHRRGGFGDLPLLGLVLGLLAGEILLVASTFRMPAAVLAPSEAGDKLAALGRTLFTRHILPVELAGVLLLVATVGAIVLTHRPASGVRRQRVEDQIARRPQDVVDLRNPAPDTPLWEEEDV